MVMTFHGHQQHQQNKEVIMSNPQLDAKLENETVQAQQTPTVNLELNVNELNVVVGGLQELPHRVVDGLLRKIMEQAQAQLKQ